MPKKQPTDSRELRGLAILTKGDAIEKIACTRWVVQSQTGHGEYEVKGQIRKKRWTCTCMDHIKRDRDCKHIIAIKLGRALRKLKRPAPPAVKEPEQPPTELRCPRCDGRDIIKRGKRMTQRGKVQIHGCKSCGYRFTPDHGFNRMKHTPEVITVAMDLWFKGVSLRKICDHLEQFYNVKVASTTPMRWIKKYIGVLGEYTEQHDVRTSNVWHIDEMTVPIRLKGEKGYHEWIWNLMDAGTRFLLACRVSKTRDIPDARRTIQEAKALAGTRPDLVVPDGLPAYIKAVPRELYSNYGLFKNPHFRYRGLSCKVSNNVLERFNGTVRERLKVFRGLDSKLSADDFVQGLKVYYNYIRPHQSLDGKTPAEVANVPIDLFGNRWMKMIRYAYTNSISSSSRLLVG